ncbi:hypothetical protein BS78_10G227200 [Paspalum vaginatum]|nr:hypothetical protein BS78_10G227200 [Paspalum vaginatum]
MLQLRQRLKYPCPIDHHSARPARRRGRGRGRVLLRQRPDGYPHSLRDEQPEPPVGRAHEEQLFRHRAPPPAQAPLRDLGCRRLAGADADGEHAVALGRAVVVVQVQPVRDAADHDGGFLREPGSAGVQMGRRLGDRAPGAGPRGEGLRPSLAAQDEEPEGGGGVDAAAAVVDAAG